MADEKKCSECMDSEYKNFENRSYMADNVGLYCRCARMRIKNNRGMKCFKVEIPDE